MKHTAADVIRAVLDYADHSRYCNSHRPPLGSRECDCGFAAAMLAAEPYLAALDEKEPYAPRMSGVALEDVTAAINALRPEQVVRIWSSEHGLWWRPNGRGYTSNWREAGLYPFADAYGRTSHCGPEKGIRYIPVEGVDAAVL